MNQKRVDRACDRCNVSRTRCDGELPCNRCCTLGHRCRYNRQVKKRGRKTNLAKQRRKTISAQEPNSPLESGIISEHSTTQQDDVQDSLQLPPLHYSGLEQNLSAVPTNASVSFHQFQHNSPPRADSPHILRGFDPILPLSRIDSLLRSALYSTPSVATGQEIPSEDLENCRYPCLRVLLPALKHALSPSAACDLLDMYYAEPGTSICSLHSPYVLSPVLRKNSVLHPSRPRSTSPALLATILWCVAQTADCAIFYMPGARQRIVNELYGIAIAHLKKADMDNWRRVPGGWQLEEESCSSLDAASWKRVRTTFSTGPVPRVDDVLTFLLLAIVISGGEYKSDCIKWWNKAVALVRYLGLHKEPSMLAEAPSRNEWQTSAEEQEEKRRTFWLVYALDRHLALSHNRALDILDAECEVFSPLPESLWQNFDIIDDRALQHRTYGPPTTISGAGFFEYFLPLMTILGDIIDFRLRRYHPRLVSHDDSSLEIIKANLTQCERTLCDFADTWNQTPSPPGIGLSKNSTNTMIAYAVYIIKVLYILLYGKWDATSMLEDDGDWITSSRFVDCSSSSIAAAQAISDILKLDPELSFMPYLFGIYLFHGSFILLLFAERMSRIGPNPSVEEACEVIIRAHEVAIVTLSTDFQKTFRRAFRSILYNARRPERSETELQALRKEVLSMYRWTMGRPGLCL